MHPCRRYALPNRFQSVTPDTTSVLQFHSSRYSYPRTSPIEARLAKENSVTDQPLAFDAPSPAPAEGLRQY